MEKLLTELQTKLANLSSSMDDVIARASSEAKIIDTMAAMVASVDAMQAKILHATFPVAVESSHLQVSP